MRIGELAKMTGLTVETIRFYENEKLIPKAERSLNNYRSYTESHYRRLMFIRHCRSLDMSLDDIRLLIDVDARRNEDAEKVHEMIHSHLKKIDEQIDALKQLRQHLSLLALCCHGNHANGEPCGIIEGLENGACCHNCENLKAAKRAKRTDSSLSHYARNLQPAEKQPTA
ncbi:MAG TPA: MerR family transcriptional regulator [Candidatus Aphodousia gallistercoris]|nr:MerR family transcriptional regulator [Candidatus Aphodousia gallistercoris]